MNIKKLISVFTTACFVFSFVLSQPLLGAVEKNREMKSINKLFEKLVIPYSAGRITDSHFTRVGAQEFGNRRIVVNIQDLHCHPEVQRNIAKVLSILDKKYSLKKVYIEGSSGPVDTSWLTSVDNKELRNTIIESLVDEGKLTGAEYYSVTSGRTDLLVGAEDHRIHTDNLIRLNTISGKQEYLSERLDGLNSDLAPLRKKYYNSKIKKLNKIVEQQNQGKLKPGKYYGLLFKKAGKLGIDLTALRNITSYQQSFSVNEKLDYDEVAVELRQFLTLLKQKLPYKAYSQLAARTGNFTDAGGLYVYLLKIVKEHDPSLVNNYPGLKKFFSFLEINQSINPIELIREEKRLLNEIRLRLAQTDSEREVVFLNEFTGSLKDYLSYKISCKDYEYVRENLTRYNILWAQYVNNRKLSLITPYVSLLDDYYRVNLKRNECLLDNCGLVEESKFKAQSSKLNSEIISELLEDSEIIVLITGGFHTPGIKELLRERGVSYMIVTPHVTKGTDLAESVYSGVLREQADIFSQGTLQSSGGQAKLKVQNIISGGPEALTLNLKQRGALDSLALYNFAKYLDEGIYRPDLITSAVTTVFEAAVKKGIPPELIKTEIIEKMFSPENLDRMLKAELKRQNAADPDRARAKRITINTDLVKALVIDKENPEIPGYDFEFSVKVKAGNNEYYDTVKLSGDKITEQNPDVKLKKKKDSIVEKPGGVWPWAQEKYVDWRTKRYKYKKGEYPSEVMRAHWADQYHLAIAPLVENFLSFLAGGAAGVIAYLITGDMLFSFQVGNISMWSLFFAGHFVPSESGKSASLGIKLIAFSIAVSNIFLGEYYISFESLTSIASVLSTASSLFLVYTVLHLTENTLGYFAYKSIQKFKVDEDKTSSAQKSAGRIELTAARIVVARFFLSMMTKIDSWSLGNKIVKKPMIWLGNHLMSLEMSLSGEELNLTRDVNTEGKVFDEDGKRLEPDAVVSDEEGSAGISLSQEKIIGKESNDTVMISGSMFTGSMFTGIGPGFVGYEGVNSKGAMGAYGSGAVEALSKIKSSVPPLRLLQHRIAGIPKGQLMSIVLVDGEEMEAEFSSSYVDKQHKWCIVRDMKVEGAEQGEARFLDLHYIKEIKYKKDGKEEVIETEQYIPLTEVSASARKKITEEEVELEEITGIESSSDGVVWITGEIDGETVLAVKEKAGEPVSLVDILTADGEKLEWQGISSVQPVDGGGVWIVARVEDKMVLAARESSGGPVVVIDKVQTSDGKEAVLQGVPHVNAINPMPDGSVWVYALVNWEVVLAVKEETGGPLKIVDIETSDGQEAGIGFIYKIESTPDGAVWISARDNEKRILLERDSSGGPMRLVDIKASDGSKVWLQKIDKMQAAPNGDFWISGHTGSKEFMAVKEKAGGPMTIVDKAETSDGKEVEFKDVFGLNVMPDGSVWFSAYIDDGKYVLAVKEKAGGPVRLIDKVEAADGKEVALNSVYSIDIMPDGALWFFAQADGKSVLAVKEKPDDPIRIVDIDEVEGSDGKSVDLHYLDEINNIHPMPDDSVWIEAKTDERSILLVKEKSGGRLKLINKAETSDGREVDLQNVSSIHPSPDGAVWFQAEVDNKKVLLLMEKIGETVKLIDKLETSDGKEILRFQCGYNFQITPDGGVLFVAFVDGGSVLAEIEKTGEPARIVGIKKPEEKKDKDDPSIVSSMVSYAVGTAKKIISDSYDYLEEAGIDVSGEKTSDLWEPPTESQVLETKKKLSKLIGSEITLYLAERNANGVLFKTKVRGILLSSGVGFLTLADTTVEGDHITRFSTSEMGDNVAISWKANPSLEPHPGESEDTAEDEMAAKEVKEVPTAAVPAEPWKPFTGLEQQTIEQNLNTLEGSEVTLYLAKEDSDGQLRKTEVSGTLIKADLFAGIRIENASFEGHDISNFDSYSNVVDHGDFYVVYWDGNPSLVPHVGEPEDTAEGKMAAKEVEQVLAAAVPADTWKPFTNQQFGKTLLDLDALKGARITLYLAEKDENGILRTAEVTGFLQSAAADSISLIKATVQGDEISSLEIDPDFQDKLKVFWDANPSLVPHVGVSESAAADKAGKPAKGFKKFKAEGQKDQLLITQGFENYAEAANTLSALINRNVILHYMDTPKGFIGHGTERTVVGELEDFLNGIAVVGDKAISISGITRIDWADPEAGTWKPHSEKQKYEIMKELSEFEGEKVTLYLAQRDKTEKGKINQAKVTGILRGAGSMPVRLDNVIVEGDPILEFNVEHIIKKSGTISLAIHGSASPSLKPPVGIPEAADTSETWKPFTPQQQMEMRKKLDELQGKEVTLYLVDGFKSGKLTKTRVKGTVHYTAERYVVIRNPEIGGNYVDKPAYGDSISINWDSNPSLVPHDGLPEESIPADIDWYLNQKALSKSELSEVLDYLVSQENPSIKQEVFSRLIQHPGRNLTNHIIDILNKEIMRSRSVKYKKYEERIGRNDLCPCGSRLKYKNCCSQPGGGPNVLAGNFMLLNLVEERHRLEKKSHLSRHMKLMDNYLEQLYILAAAGAQAAVDKASPDEEMFVQNLPQTISIVESLMLICGPEAVLDFAVHKLEDLLEDGAQPKDYGPGIDNKVFEMFLLIVMKSLGNVDDKSEHMDILKRIAAGYLTSEQAEIMQHIFLSIDKPDEVFDFLFESNKWRLLSSLLTLWLTNDKESIPLEILDRLDTLIDRLEYDGTAGSMEIVAYQEVFLSAEEAFTDEQKQRIQNTYKNLLNSMKRETKLADDEYMDALKALRGHVSDKELTELFLRQLADSDSFQPYLRVQINDGMLDESDISDLLFTAIDEDMVNRLHTEARAGFYDLLGLVRQPGTLGYLLNAFNKENNNLVKAAVAGQLEDRYENAGQLLAAVYPEKSEELAKLYILIPLLEDMSCSGFSTCPLMQREGIADMTAQLEYAKDSMGNEEYGNQPSHWSNLHDLKMILPFRRRRAKARAYGYSLPYSLDTISTEAIEQEKMDVAYIESSPVDTENKDMLRKKYMNFQDKLINSNFIALDLIVSNTGSMKKKTALQIMKNIEKMLESLQELNESSASVLRSDFDKIKRDFGEEWEELSDNDELPDALRRRVTRIDVSESLHALINRIHSEGTRVLNESLDSAKVSEAVTIRGHEFKIANIGEGSLVKGRRVFARGLKPIIDAFKGLGRGVDTRHMKNPLILLDEYMSWSASFGSHRIEIFADLKNPDEGGFFRMRYFEAQEIHVEGNELRAHYLVTLLNKLGVQTTLKQSEDQQYIVDGVLDKDSGAYSVEQIENAISLTIRALSSCSFSLDYGFQAIYRHFYSNTSFKDEVMPKAKLVAADMAEIMYAEGILPFYVVPGDMRDLRLYRKYQYYLKESDDREKLRKVLNDKLTEWGLSLIPENVHFGQRIIEEYYTKPVQEALVRGEFILNDKEMSVKNPDYDPIPDTIESILKDDDASMQTALSISSLPKDLLDFRTIGYVGRLSAVCAQVELGSGEWIIVNGLSDPDTGRLLYAAGSLRTESGRTQEAGLERMQELLTAEGYSMVIAETPSKPQKAFAAKLMRSPPKAQEPGAKPVKGLAASAGSGNWIAGQVTFNRKYNEDEDGKNKVFVVPFTTPDDMDAIESAKAVVTTGGGLLSHAGITTREFGVPSVILPGAGWQGKDKQKEVRVSFYEGGAAEKDSNGLWVSREARSGSRVLREGDVVLVNGKEGLVSVFRQESQELLREASELMAAIEEGEKDVKELELWINDKIKDGTYLQQLPDVIEYLFNEYLLDRTKDIKETEIFSAILEIVNGIKEKSIKERLEQLQTRAFNDRLEQIENRLEDLKDDIEFIKTRDEGERTVSELERAIVFLYGRGLGDQIQSIDDRLAKINDKQKKLETRIRSKINELEADSKDSIEALAQRELSETDLPEIRKVLRSARKDDQASGVRKIIFVCTGNTCRSPMAEYFMKQMLKEQGITDVEIISRGTSVYRESGIAENSAEVLSDYGIGSKKHLSKPLTEDDLKDADSTLIIGLSRSHVDKVLAMQPELEGRAFRIKDFASNSSDGGDVADPYMQSIDVYKETGQEIRSALEGVVSRLRYADSLNKVSDKKRELSEIKKQKIEKMDRSVYALGEIDDDYVEFVGGKSAKLGEILKVVREKGGYVPEGLAVTANAFERFLKESGIEDEFINLTAELDTRIEAAGSSKVMRREVIREYSEKIRGLIESGELHSDTGLGKLLLQSLDDHGMGKELLAVRSSAVQEDTKKAAFAGAAETYLYVDREALLDKVKETWMSFWLARGIQYRAKHGISQGEVKPAVTVQTMADASKAGVIFTINPVNGQNEVVTNCSYGLGEAVVSGLVQADMYVSRKSDGEELTFPFVGSKRVKVIRRKGETGTEETGTDEAAVSLRDRDKECLSKQEVAKLTEIAVALEDHFGYALDVEFAVSGDKIAVLQARPVTKKAEKTKNKPVEAMSIVTGKNIEGLDERKEQIRDRLAVLADKWERYLKYPMGTFIGKAVFKRFVKRDRILQDLDLSAEDRKALVEELNENVSWKIHAWDVVSSISALGIPIALLLTGVIGAAAAVILCAGLLMFSTLSKTLVFDVSHNDISKKTFERHKMLLKGGLESTVSFLGAVTAMGLAMLVLTLPGLDLSASIPLAAAIAALGGVFAVNAESWANRRHLAWNSAVIAQRSDLGKVVDNKTLSIVTGHAVEAARPRTLPIAIINALEDKGKVSELMNYHNIDNTTRYVAIESQNLGQKEESMEQLAEAGMNQVGLMIFDRPAPGFEKLQLPGLPEASHISIGVESSIGAAGKTISLPLYVKRADGGYTVGILMRDINLLLHRAGITDSDRAAEIISRVQYNCYYWLMYKQGMHYVNSGSNWSQASSIEFDMPNQSKKNKNLLPDYFDIGQEAHLAPDVFNNRVEVSDGLTLVFNGVEEAGIMVSDLNTTVVADSKVSRRVTCVMNQTDRDAPVERQIVRLGNARVTDSNDAVSRGASSLVFRFDIRNKLKVLSGLKNMLKAGINKWTEKQPIDGQLIIAGLYEGNLPSTEYIDYSALNETRKMSSSRIGALKSKDDSRQMIGKRAEGIRALLVSLKQDDDRQKKFDRYKKSMLKTFRGRIIRDNALALSVFSDHKDSVYQDYNADPEMKQSAAAGLISMDVLDLHIDFILYKMWTAKDEWNAIKKDVKRWKKVKGIIPEIPVESLTQMDTLVDLIKDLSKQGMKGTCINTAKLAEPVDELLADVAVLKRMGEIYPKDMLLQKKIKEVQQKADKLKDSYRQAFKSFSEGFSKAGFKQSFKVRFEVPPALAFLGQSLRDAGIIEQRICGLSRIPLVRERNVSLRPVSDGKVTSRKQLTASMGKAVRGSNSYDVVFDIGLPESDGIRDIVLDSKLWSQMVRGVVEFKGIIKKSGVEREREMVREGISFLAGRELPEVNDEVKRLTGYLGEYISDSAEAADVIDKIDTVINAEHSVFDSGEFGRLRDKWNLMVDAGEEKDTSLIDEMYRDALGYLEGIVISMIVPGDIAFIDDVSFYAFGRGMIIGVARGEEGVLDVPKMIKGSGIPDMKLMDDAAIDAVSSEILASGNMPDSVSASGYLWNLWLAKRDIGDAVEELLREAMGTASIASIKALKAAG